QRFGHFLPFAVPYQPVVQHILEWDFSSKLKGGKDHPRYPEINDVVSGNENIRREKALEVLAVLIRPAECGERPQGRAEPRVQNVVVLHQFMTSAFGAGIHGLPSDMQLATGFAIPSRNAVAPP